MNNYCNYIIIQYCIIFYLLLYIYIFREILKLVIDEYEL